MIFKPVQKPVTIRYLLIFFYILTSVPGLAQVKDPEVLPADTLYFRRYDEYMHLKTFVRFEDLSIALKSKNDLAPKVVYRPNQQGTMGIGVRLFDIGLSFSLFTPSFFQKSQEKYGKTRFTNISASVYGKKWAYDAGYLNYRGFYLSNANKIYQDINEEDPLPLRGDIEAFRVFGGVSYIFNHQRFSPRAGFKHNHRQLISKGSFMLKGTLSYTRIAMDSSIVPVDLQDVYGQGSSLEESQFFTLALLPGYGYNRVIHKNFFCNFQASAGFGLQYQDFVNDGGAKEQLGLRPQLNLKLGIGYDNTRIFVGTVGSINRSYSSFDQLVVRPDSQSVTIFMGYRFKKFGLFKKYSVKDLLPGAKRRRGIRSIS